MPNAPPKYRPAGYKPPTYNATRNRDYGRQAWREYATGFKRQHPLCAECERQGTIRPSRLVDHIEPVSGEGDPLFWEPTNHQALCWACHNRKTNKDTAAGKNRRRG